MKCGRCGSPMELMYSENVDNFTQYEYLCTICWIMLIQTIEHLTEYGINVWCDWRSNG